MAKLTAKQQRFVGEYLVDLNATQAAKRAGYSAKTAKVTGHENLTKPDIQSAIQAAQQRRTAATSWTARTVLNRLIEMAELDVLDIISESGAIKPVDQWTKAWRVGVGGLEVVETAGGALTKIKWPDRLRNLELIGKHIDIGAFSERADAGIDDIEPVTSISYVEVDARKVH